MNEVALMDQVLQRQQKADKTTVTLNRTELGSLAALLATVNMDMESDPVYFSMLNEQLGKIMIRLIQKLMTVKSTYKLTMSATERYVICQILADWIDYSRIGAYENNLVLKLSMALTS